MPNTKSAEHRVRSSARRHLHNRSIKHGLKTLEQRYGGLVTAGNKPDAAAALREVFSALDKAAKSGVVHKATASRKKSRLALRFNGLK